MNKIFKRIGLPCLLVLLMLFSAYPYVFCFFLGFPSEKVMIISFIGIFAMYCLLDKSGVRGGIPHIGGIMICQSVVWLLYALAHQDTSYLIRILLIFETYLALLLLFKKNVILRFATIYNWSLAIQGVLGVVAFFLLFAGLISPIAKYYFNDTRYELCYILTCSNTVYGNFMRVGGYFDEPGALAYWGVFALVINKLTSNNKLVEYGLLFSLLFTFSAAYFAVLPIYFICFYYKQLKKLIIIMLIGVPIVYTCWNYLSDSDYVAVYTTERFEKGSIRSTRFEQAENAKKLFYESPIIGHGAKNILENYVTATENPYETLAADGIVGTIFIYLPLIFLMLKYRSDRYALYGMLILIMDYMQRPFHVNQMQYFMLYLYSSIIIFRNVKTKETYGK